MLKFTRKNKKLVIPVGINPSYNIDSSTLYNVSDADVVANDVIAGKIAYGADGKIVGTLDIESEKSTSFENGYAAGQEYGYESGYGVGREEGFDAGIEDQKAKLETITITENGTYNREDGYNEVIVEVPDLNGDYNEGYQEGYDNGYRVGNTDGVAIGREEIITEQNDANITSTDVVEGKIGYSKNNTKIVGNLNIQTIKDASYNQGYSEGYDAGESAGIEEGKQEIISGMDDATITPSTVIKGEIGYGANNERIVGEFEYVEGFNFGKIGYSQELSNEVNSDTAEKLAYSKQLYDAWDPNRTSAQGYFQNNTSLVYAPLFNTSNVTNMNSMFKGCSNLTIVPEFDTSSVTDMVLMFNNCSNLTSVPKFDTSSVTDMASMFNTCPNLTSVPEFDTSNVITMNYMFYNCSNLTSVPEFDTSSVINMASMFEGCSNLITAPKFDTISVTNMNSMFNACSNLTSVPEYNASSITGDNRYVACLFGTSTFYWDALNSMTDFGGLLNLGKSYGSVKYNEYKDLLLQMCPNLTYESCMNIINKVYDLNLNTVNTIVPNIKFSATSYALLSADDIAIATAKGWSVISA